MRRVTVGVLAAFYLLQAAWLLHAGVDALCPRVAVALSPDACCAAACGCPEEVRLRGDCCCEKVEKPPVRAAVPSAFDVARCSGLEMAMAQAVSLPALDAFPRLDAVPPLATALSLPELQNDVDVPSRALDKVPL